VADDGAATAAEAAAAWAMGSALEFVPPTLAAARQRQTRAMAVRMFVAALTLLVIAGVAELWGAKRELDAVRAERAAIRDDVAPLLAARDSLDELRQRASSVNDLHARAPRWTRALFDLALLLPEDAHITTLRTAGDTLLVEGTSGRAGDALQAMKKAGSLTDVRITGTVERELQDGETSVERFQMRAVITPMALPREAVKPAMPARAIREAALTEAARRRP
jgi:Tfp pilus assembly protein PilN